MTTQANQNKYLGVASWIREHGSGSAEKAELTWKTLDRSRRLKT